MTAAVSFLWLPSPALLSSLSRFHLVLPAPLVFCFCRFVPVDLHRLL